MNEIPEKIILNVAKYIMRRWASDIDGAIELRDKIYSDIKEYGLEEDEVFFFFGDPDDPRTRETTYSEAHSYIMGG